ncbi:bcl-2-like protein 1 [Acanthochromis polyacanthus]|nr:bcl-2-like protein 1 [Acanthochromis polyacanthus]
MCDILVELDSFLCAPSDRRTGDSVTERRTASRESRAFVSVLAGPELVCQPCVGLVFTPERPVDISGPWWSEQRAAGRQPGTVCVHSNAARRTRATRTENTLARNMSQNRELVVFYIKYKLSQRNYPLNHMVLNEAPNRTDGGEARLGEDQRTETHANGTFNGTSPGTPPPSPRRLASTATMDAVKEALRDTANEFELRYARAFSDLHSQLHITPATAYQSFENVMDEVFRDGVNWGRIVGLFAFGGALCVECVEKEMSPLVGRIVEWMTVYLDNHIQDWIQGQGGWERFAEIFGQDAAAESRRSQESFKKWLLVGMTVVTGVVVGSLIAQKRL